MKKVVKFEVGMEEEDGKYIPYAKTYVKQYTHPEQDQEFAWIDFMTECHRKFDNFIHDVRGSATDAKNKVGEPKD